MASIAKFDTWQNTAGVNYSTVLQVQSTTLTNTFSTTAAITSGGAAVTGLSVNITPKYATSKILVFGHVVAGTNPTTQAYLQLKRTISGTTVAVGNGVSVSTRPTVISRSYINNTNVCLTNPYTYFDSPATTNSITYQIYLGTESSASAFINRTETDGDNSSGSRGSSSITVMEIAQ